MKKTIITILTIIVIAVIGAIVVSCNINEKSAKIESADNSFAQLNSQLADYNTQFIEANDIDPTTRAIRLPRWFRITLADALGAAFGSLGGLGGAIWLGTAASIGQVCRCNVAPSCQTISPILNVNGNYDYKDLGNIHNAIIMEIYNDDPANFNIMTETQMFAKISQKVEKYFGPQPTNVVTKCHNQYSEVIALQSEFDENSLDSTFDNIILAKPQVSDELTVVKQYCNTLDRIVNEDLQNEYTDGFIQVVDKSTIHPNSKHLIISTVSVAECSDDLWVEQ